MDAWYASGSGVLVGSGAHWVLLTDPDDEQVVRDLWAVLTAPAPGSAPLAERVLAIVEKAFGGDPPGLALVDFTAGGSTSISRGSGHVHLAGAGRVLTLDGGAEIAERPASRRLIGGVVAASQVELTPVSGRTAPTPIAKASPPPPASGPLIDGIPDAILLAKGPEGPPPLSRMRRPLEDTSGTALDTSEPDPLMVERITEGTHTTIQPARESAHEPADLPEVAPEPDLVVEPVEEPAADQEVGPDVEPAAEPAVEPVSEPAEDPATESVVAPVEPPHPEPAPFETSQPEPEAFDPAPFDPAPPAQAPFDPAPPAPAPPAQAPFDPAPPAPAPPTQAPFDPAPFNAAPPADGSPDLDGSTTFRPPHLSHGTAATVLAVSCPLGHLTPPTLPQCRVCHQHVAPQEPRRVDRPTLGGLRLPTGEVVPLDRGVLIGRKPTPAEGSTDWPHLVHLPSDHSYVSRRHLQIELDGWDVIARDLNSRGGSTIAPPGRDAEPMRPGEAYVLAPGTVVDLAHVYAVRYESGAIPR